MLFIHPVLQMLATLLSLYTFYFGIQRFRFLHLHQKVAFKWKQHLLLGWISLGILFLGMLLGFYMVNSYWHNILMTGAHGAVGFISGILIIFGFGTGLYMHLKKRKRRFLPMTHGIVNLVILILAMSQAVTGWKVIKMFVLGI